jgi:hypothetical protein
MDLDHTHARLIAALKGVAEGKTLSDSVPVAPYGTSTKICTALRDGAQYLNESFHDEHLGLVDAALNKLGLVLASTQKCDVANAILRALKGGMK